MFKKSSYIVFVLGLVGALTFWFLRSEIDYSSNGAVKQSSSEIKASIETLAKGLGFSMDSLSIASLFQQHGRYVSSIQDSLNGKLPPSVLNEKNTHIQSWVSVIGKKGDLGQVIIDPSSVFNSNGNLTFRTSNYGKVIRINENEDAPNPTFIQGDSIEAVGNKIVGDLLDYSLEEYTLLKNEISDSLFIVGGEGEIATSGLNGDNANESNQIELSWRRKSITTLTPEFLTLSLEPIVKEVNNSAGFSTKFGYKVTSFVAKNELEPLKLNISGDQRLDAFQIFFFVSVFILSILVFAVGIRNIFKGKVEWRRALFVFLSISAAFFGWRMIFFTGVFSEFFDGGNRFVIGLNNLLIGLILGLYASMAYIGWEAFARSQKNGQVELIDAFWQRRFFVRETGSALIHGFFIGLLLLGVFSVVVYFADTFYLQSDSQFGFTEASIKSKILTINISAWATVWLVGFAQIGFVYGFCKYWVKNGWVAIILSILFSSILLTVLGRLIATPMTLYGDFVIFLSLGFIAVYTYEKYGIVTTNTAWWVFVCVLMMVPYIGSQSIEMASTWWVQSFIIAGVPIFGFISLKYGIPVSDVGDYIPEYQERMAQHLRVEKEIEIARESQYKLMPTQPPVGKGFDVYGFFLPSFEVGGDYFDYVLSKDEDDNPKGLSMVVVDVSGKAMRAAMPAIFTSGLLLARMKEDYPKEILTNVNEPIFTRTDKRTFITCAMARYDFNSKILSVVNAGHCKPVLKRNGVAEFIQTPDPRFPLGFRPDTKYNAQDVKLKKGDVFLLYSDGLPEAVNDKGERFGFDEVPRLLERIHTEKLSSNEIVQEIKRTVQKFSNYQLEDDTTVICLKV